MGKPNPAAFTEVVARLGVEPQDAVMVGDSWERDVRGAVSAGLRAVWGRAGTNSAREARRRHGGREDLGPPRRPRHPSRNGITASCQIGRRETGGTPWSSEQRWVLSTTPTGLADPVEISDRYLRDTDLRLRRMESAEGVVWKLGQKVRVRAESPEVVKMTNIYLRKREYEFLGGLEGAMLTKTRWPWRQANGVFSVDVFHGHLAGLVLAEIELAVDDDPLDPPEGAVADVSVSDRFTGGSLAWLDDEGVRQLLAYVAVLGE